MDMYPPGCLLFLRRLKRLIRTWHGRRRRWEAHWDAVYISPWEVIDEVGQDNTMHAVVGAWLRHGSSRQVPKWRLEVVDAETLYRISATILCQIQES
jgi:hypothetical protein